MRSFKSMAAGVGEIKIAIGLVQNIRPLHDLCSMYNVHCTSTSTVPTTYYPPYTWLGGGNFNNREILLCRIVIFRRIIYHVYVKMLFNFGGAECAYIRLID